VKRCGVDISGSGQEIDYCEHGNETSDSMGVGGGGFLDLSEYFVLKKDFAP
jgi:hypothetical protein